MMERRNGLADSASAGRSTQIVCVPSYAAQFQSPLRAHAARFTRYEITYRCLDYSTERTIGKWHTRCYSMNNETGVALGLGALIGLERQFTHHEAGLKTSALVAAGSALFVSMANSFSEPDRIVAQWKCWRQCWWWLRIYCRGTYATRFRRGKGRGRLDSGHSLPRLLCRV